MTDDVFTEPDETRDQWVDVRMAGPEEGEEDVVVLDGRVQYVDPRGRPEPLGASFVACLVDDVGKDRASSTLATVTQRNDPDPDPTEG